MKTDSQLEIVPTEAEIIAKINELHAEAGKLSQNAKAYAGQAIAKAFECGRLLTLQKKITKYGDWGAWLDENCNFKKTTAYNYIALFRKISSGKGAVEEFHHGEILAGEGSPKTLRQAFIATGILPETAKPKLSGRDESTVAYVRHIDFITSWFRKLTGEKSVDDWSFAERQALIHDLTPLMEIFNKLVDLQENMK